MAKREYLVAAARCPRFSFRIRVASSGRSLIHIHPHPVRHGSLSEILAHSPLKRMMVVTLGGKSPELPAMHA